VRRQREGRARETAADRALLDDSGPGVLGALADQRTIARLERQLARTGVMPGSQMAATFDILRANDLLFNYVVSNWLMGQRPPVFDILAWNIDSTQLPAAMHSFYLRSLHGRSELAAGTLELADRTLQLGPSRPIARSTLRSTAALIRRDALTRRRVKDPPDCAFW